MIAAVKGGCYFQVNNRYMLIYLKAKLLIRKSDPLMTLTKFFNENFSMCGSYMRYQTCSNSNLTLFRALAN